MTTIESLSLHVFRAICDFNFTANMMPLKRSTKFELGVESAVRHPRLKYGAWTVQAVVCMQKVISCVMRWMTEAISLFSLLHLIVLLQVIPGQLCAIVTVIMADEAEIYFSYHNFVSRQFHGESDLC